MKLRSPEMHAVDIKLRPAETSSYLAFYLVILSVLICMIRSFCWERIRRIRFRRKTKKNDGDIVVPVGGTLRKEEDGDNKA